MLTHSRSRRAAISLPQGSVPHNVQAREVGGGGSTECAGAPVQHNTAPLQRTGASMTRSYAGGCCLGPSTGLISTARAANKGCGSTAVLQATLQPRQLQQVSAPSCGQPQPAHGIPPPLGGALTPALPQPAGVGTPLRFIPLQAHGERIQ